MDGLKDEGIRWDANVTQLDERLRLLVGNVMVSASFIAYIAPFDTAFRSKLLDERWIVDAHQRAIPLSPSFKPMDLLTDPPLVASWRTEGLPADPLSSENAAIITRCSRFPLIIDPQLQVHTRIDSAPCRPSPAPVSASLVYP